MEVKIEETPLLNKWGDKVRHLVIDDYIWMSNDDIEMDQIHKDTEDAYGNCWIGGLGLGLMPEVLLKNPNVDLITVVEINEDIINLLWKGKLADPRIEIVHGDAIKGDGLDLNRNDWFYLDTYIEPTKRVYEEEIKPWLRFIDPYLCSTSIVKWWCKEQMESGNFAPFEFEL